ncbi:hypothetical protein TWF696_001872 [Orbilia brochopaga]|uniref:Uncharacterized protein n=1 Tax=Orbilia brochopaga TaxID=3140254 RepID=A0AAV9UAF3_9PEZI
MPRLPLSRNIVASISKRHHTPRKIAVVPKVRQINLQQSIPRRQQQSGLHSADKTFHPPAAYGIINAPASTATGTAVAPSAVAFLDSLDRCGIRVSPAGSKMISRILHDIPYDGIDLFWVRRIETAVRAARISGAAALPSSFSPDGPYVTARGAATMFSHISSQEGVARQADMLAQRLLADPTWNEMFDMLIFDDGVRGGVEGEVELKAILEMMLASRWILAPVEYDGVYQSLASTSAARCLI